MICVYCGTQLYVISIERILIILIYKYLYNMTIVDITQISLLDNIGFEILHINNKVCVNININKIYIN